MKLTQKIRRGERIRLVHPESGDVVAHIDCTRGRADLTFEGWLVEIDATPSVSRRCPRGCACGRHQAENRPSLT